jgi:hypothetical protein
VNTRHSRESGNPNLGFLNMDSRLRGNDERISTSPLARRG